MIFKDLQDYINALEKKKELLRVKIETDPIYEMAEIADRLVKQKGKAVLFEKPKGSKIPVAMNLFGTIDRTQFALGVESLDELSLRVKELINIEIPTNFWDKLRNIMKFKELSHYLPKIVKNAPCQQVIEDDVDLFKYPILKTWPQDGGRFITLPLVFTKNPITKKQNCGMYRMQVFDKNTTGMHWHIHKDGAYHFSYYKKNKIKMPVCVCIGADPITIYSATAPLPEDIDEMLFASFLRKEGIELVKSSLWDDIYVPANAEIVLEGYVDPDELMLEGPFGDHTGYYSLADYYPVFHIQRITRKKNPIYPATIVGKPPMEDAYLGKATERLFLPIIQKILPEIVDINLPIEGIFHNFAFVSIKKQFPGHAFKVINALWGLGMMSLTKIIVVFDDNVDVQNISEVIWRLGNNIDPQRDIIFTKGPIDVLDHASNIAQMGSKMGIDATKKLKSEGFLRDWPDDIEMPKEIKDLVDKKWSKYFK
ncbi:MAG: menaquinone biosynthesis decarboxylase [Desulfurella sp.]|uniref:4-hydroxy-3-polyprenylbenzoate decarboxylase n=1 Tax=Desulfurella multipotens TaxID=79269 RepID=A0A1G6K4G0_9BACT|nr:MULTISPECIES: menaquinone biosynthesis decarboxylase [Desulfurella]PMP65512.1 MAG: menaquinone biosynthesis decarboxylase [Desulfurella multipotens]PMP90431.1 MAG: menaquinone biosynthesis decarboxylase [Desulfurella sp.]SDC25919.1 4-hydroxy-3-polyprenylbenzoate decarboxylase [Desulfurella multipotens]HEX13849.1 menaquinone biosynthesis decarboxylase [Desulfurella acetivorans]